MRIPNQLQGDPLYRRERKNPRNRSSESDPSDGGGKRRSGSGRLDQSWRRVIRLVIVLALVLVLMRQAGKPEVYHIFFPEPAQTVSTSTATHTNAAPFVVAVDDPSENGVADSVLSEYSENADRWAVEQSQADVINRLAEWLGIGSVTQIDSQPTDANASQVVISWPSWADNEVSRAAIAIAIQRRLIHDAKDGTVWRAADVPALTATLAMHSSRSIAATGLRRQAAYPDAPVVGVLPLLQQPDWFLGRRVVARGDVVRIERINAPDNPFAIDHYWNLWLVPKDASGRPWLVIVPRLPDEMSGLVAATPDEDPSWLIQSPYPLVNVSGEFVKRLSYQSAAGAELTPVVVGHIESIQTNGNPAISLPSSTAGAGGSTAGAGGSTAGAGVAGPSTWIVVGCAIVLGVLFSAWVMWRTAAFNRQLRARRQRDPAKLQLVWWVATAVSYSLAGGSFAQAQSILDLLPGYEPNALQSIATQPENSNEFLLDNWRFDDRSLSKLIYRFGRLDDAVLKQRRSSVDAKTRAKIGDSVLIDGTIIQMRSLPVPPDLADILDFKTIQLVMLQGVSSGRSVVAIPSLDAAIGIDDRLSGSGVRIGNANDFDESDDFDGSSINVDVGARLAWSPANPSSPSDAFLSAAGVDLNRLATIDRLDRQPLSDEDSDVFFAMIGAAKAVNGSLNKDIIRATPVDLLQTPRSFTGRWIAIDAETVRVTRVVVQSKQRQAEVGGSFYYQIDAIGDLGRVQLKIEVPGHEPVLMENRYPITIVTATLPKFLQDPDGDWVSTITVPIRVEGFFYRLWSYESDFMNARGGKQIAPLIIAGAIQDRRPRSSDPIGVSAIGKIAAVSVLLGIAGVILFGWWTRRGDRKSRRRRLSDPSMN